MVVLGETLPRERVQHEDGTVNHVGVARLIYDPILGRVLHRYTFPRPTAYQFPTPAFKFSQDYEWRSEEDESWE